jgi:Peptidase family M23
MLLTLTTRSLRLVLALVAFFAWSPAAHAWSWPVEGPVLRPFSYDEAHPYVAGQHRGIDIGADAVGQAVVAPAAGTVSFAGTVPTNGISVTIQTADGHSVTLTHLGSIVVAKGATVAEQDTVGTVGTSGTAELGGPYVHLGIRVTADPAGYVDPLTFLPPAATGGATLSDPPATQPSSSRASAAPAQKPQKHARAVPARSPVSKTQASTASRSRSRTSQHENTPVQEPRTQVRTRLSSQRPAGRAHPRTRTSHPAETERRHLTEPDSSSRPDVETATPGEPTGLDAGHESLRRTPTAVLPVILNGVAALFAVGAALAAARTRRRRDSTSPVAAAQVIRLPRPSLEREPVSRAV